MKIEVIENGYCVTDKLTDLGIVDETTFKRSYTQLLYKGDIWETDFEYEYDAPGEHFRCIEGKWKGEISDGWWEYKYYKRFFKIIE